MKTNKQAKTTIFQKFLRTALVASGLTLMMPLASAYDKHDRSQRNGDYRYADVIEVEPQFKRVRVDVPRRECWEEEVTYSERRNSHHSNEALGSTIAGGLIGGVVGRQIGGGSGRDAMTVVGAIVGSAIGSNRGHQHGSSGHERERVEIVERCETRREVREEERLDGYRVTYVYDGREYTTRTRNDPGDKIRVRVSVTPSE